MLLNNIIKRKDTKMIKLLKKLRPIDWVFMTIIVGLTILQVYCVMTMTDYISYIMKSITYVNYKNHPELISLGNDMTLGNIIPNVFTWEQFDNAISTGSFAGLDPSKQSELSTIVHSIATSSVNDIWFNGIMLIVIALGYMCVQALIVTFASFIAASFATNVRSEINKKVSKMSLNNINSFSIPSLITRTSNDLETVQMTILLVTRMFFAAPITVIWAVIKIQASSFELTMVNAVAIIALVICLILIMLIVIPKFKISQKYIDRLNGITEESLKGVRVVRAFNAEKYQERKFDTANKDLMKLNLFTGHAIGLMSPVMTLLMNGVTLALYYVGAILINNNTMIYADLVSFAQLSSQIIMSFMLLLMLFIFYPRASVSSKRINEVLDSVDEITDPKEEKQCLEKGTVEFKNVSFHYPGASENIFSDVSFKANKGETVAIIGATGSGKTTLINLIPRLYDCTSGEVLIDGVNVKDLKQETLHKKIGFIPQKGLLFSGTIKSNLMLGNDDLTADELKEVCDISCASEFVEKMNDKYESSISQGGTNVSGGQRQRLCIARALAIKPEIIVFDDSFSALDFKTDLAVRQNIKNKMPEATKVIVAQRIGTIMDADEIIVLEDGKVVGQGKHKDLLKSCKTYLDIALSQLSKEELGL